MDPQAQSRPCYHRLRLYDPRTFEKKPRLKRGASAGPAPAGSLTEGQQYAAEAQHPQGPHGAQLVRVSSPF